MSQLASAATVALVGLSCKAFINSGLCTLSVNGLHILTNALESASRHHGQGVLTVANHISTLDDPIMWGVLPAHYYLRSRTTRWSLGASDIIFTNPIFRVFFRLGQTIETFRGQGIHQHAVNYAIKQINQGGWVHLFSEGKIGVPATYPRVSEGIARLPRFKWGIGRMIMESKLFPVIIPIWLEGFDKLMPQGRSFPYKYLPRPGTELSITFGNPIPPDSIRQGIQGFLTESDLSFDPKSQGEFAEMPGWLLEGTLRRSDTSIDRYPGKNRILAGQELRSSRIRVTEIIHDTVQRLGYSISGRLLNRTKQS